MFKNKKIVAILLCLVILSQASGVMAVSFSDVTKTGNNGWAYDYIMDLAEKGVINGYPDGTFRPADNIALLETVSLLYGVMNPSKADTNAALAKHGDYIKTSLPDVKWGQDKLAYIIEKGVLTKTDLADAQDSKMLMPGTKVFPSRISVAMMTARALGLSPKTTYNLTYKDLDKISEAQRGYLAALIEVDVLSQEGSDGSFLPEDKITRAQLSKIIKQAYDWNAKYNEETLTDSGEVVEIVKFADYSHIIYKTRSSSTNKSVKVEKGAKILDKNGKNVEIKDLEKFKGSQATIIYVNNSEEKLAKEIKFTTDGSLVDGVFTLVDFRTSNGKNYVKLKDSNGRELEEIQIVSDYALDGDTEVKLYSLRGKELEIKFTAGVISQAKVYYGDQGQYRIEGISTDGNRITLVKNTSSNREKEEYYSINNNTIIVRKNDDRRISKDSLRVGQTVDITKKYGFEGSYLEKIVVYDGNKISDFQYYFDSIDLRNGRIYVKENKSSGYNDIKSFPLANDLYFNRKYVRSSYDINLTTRDKINLRFDSNNRVIEITTVGTYDRNTEKVNLEYNTYYREISVESKNHNTQVVSNSTRGINFYIDDRSASFEDVVAALQSLNKNYSFEAKYVNGSLDTIYLISSYYNN